MQYTARPEAAPCCLNAPCCSPPASRRQGSALPTRPPRRPHAQPYRRRAPPWATTACHIDENADDDHLPRPPARHQHHERTGSSQRHADSHDDRRAGEDCGVDLDGRSEHCFHVHAEVWHRPPLTTAADPRSPAAHYANAFTIETGRCFRMVQLPGAGHPMHCPEPATTHGPWRSGADQLNRVDACDGHREAHCGHRSVGPDLQRQLHGLVLRIAHGDEGGEADEADRSSSGRRHPGQDEPATPSEKFLACVDQHAQTRRIDECDTCHVHNNRTTTTTGRRHGLLELRHSSQVYFALKLHDGDPTYQLGSDHGLQFSRHGRDYPSCKWKVRAALLAIPASCKRARPGRST